jgi:hypothetical protein
MDLPNLMGRMPGRRAAILRGPPPLPARASGLEPAPDAPTLASPSSLGDPTIAALLRLVAAERTELEATQHAPLEGAAMDWSAEEVDELTDRLDASVRESRRLSAQLERANNELRRLRDRNAHLADALGACGSCWGEDSACPECQGCGRPGRSMPEERLFEKIVMPAVRLMRLCDLRSSPPRPEPAPSRLCHDTGVVNLYAHALLDRGTRGQ